MSVHILKSRAKSSFASLEFASYNEAIAYRQKVAALNPSKPYKRIRGAVLPLWVITVRQTRTDRATYESFPEAPSYLGWQEAA